MANISDKHQIIRIVLFPDFVECSASRITLFRLRNSVFLRTAHSVSECWVLACFACRSEGLPLLEWRSADARATVGWHSSDGRLTLERRSADARATVGWRSSDDRLKHERHFFVSCTQMLRAWKRVNICETWYHLRNVSATMCPRLFAQRCIVANRRCKSTSVIPPLQVQQRPSPRVSPGEWRQRRAGGLAPEHSPSPRGQATAPRHRQDPAGGREIPRHWHQQHEPVRHDCPALGLHARRRGDLRLPVGACGRHPVAFRRRDDASTLCCVQQ